MGLRWAGGLDQLGPTRSPLADPANRYSPNPLRPAKRYKNPGAEDLERIRAFRERNGVTCERQTAAQKNLARALFSERGCRLKNGTTPTVTLPKISMPMAEED